MLKPIMSCRVSRAARFATGAAAFLLQSSCQGPYMRNSAIETVAPPIFLTAEIATFFAKVDGFRAKLEFESSNNSATNSMQLFHGELLGQDGNLLFIPNATGEQHTTPGMSILWNAKSNVTFVLCEPMQAYAPAPPHAGGTNCTIQETIHPGNQIINGQSCQKWFAICSDGKASPNVFTVWRAAPPNEIPVKIEYQDDLSGVTLRLSKISFTRMPRDLFAIPEGFTRYDRVETMTTELMARRSSKTSEAKNENPVATPDGQSRHPGGSK